MHSFNSKKTKSTRINWKNWSSRDMIRQNLTSNILPKQVKTEKKEEENLFTRQLKTKSVSTYFLIKS